MKGAPTMAIAKDDKKINGFERWNVRQAMCTLGEAERIKLDTKLMEAIGILAKERLEETAGILHHVEHATNKK